MNQLEQIQSSISIQSKQQSESQLLSSVVVHNQIKNNHFNQFDKLNNGCSIRNQNFSQDSLKDFYQKLVKAGWSDNNQNDIENKPIQFQSLKPTTKYTTVSESDSNSDENSNLLTYDFDDQEKEQQNRNYNFDEKIKQQKFTQKYTKEQKIKKSQISNMKRKKEKSHRNQGSYANYVCLSSASESYIKRNTNSPCKMLLLREISKNALLHKELQRTKLQNIQLRKILCSISEKAKINSTIGHKGQTQKMRKRASKQGDNNTRFRKNNPKSLQKTANCSKNKPCFWERKDQTYTTFMDQRQKQKSQINFRNKEPLQSRSIKMVSGRRDQMAAKRRLYTETK